MRFLGVGISSALGLAIFTIFIIIMLKVVSVKYPSPATEIIQTI